MTSSVQFKYDDEALLLWRVRWTSLERAVRSGDDARVARLATQSARDNQDRNPKVDMGLLEAAITKFGAAGFAVAHTGSYHTALFKKDVDEKVLNSFTRYVLRNSKEIADRQIDIFDTAQAAERRMNDLC